MTAHVLGTQEALNAHYNLSKWLADFMGVEVLSSHGFSVNRYGESFTTSGFSMGDYTRPDYWASVYEDIIGEWDTTGEFTQCPLPGDNAL